MKTPLLFTAILLLVCSGFSCQESNIREENRNQVSEKMGLSQSRYRPVYFNFTRKKLYYNGNQQMSGAVFLDMCRGIQDSAVQYQVSRYDAFTKKKAALLGAMGINGVAGVIVVNTATSNYGYGGVSPVLITAGVIALVSAPILAISTRVPHMKRKEVLFRDLPIAYNQFVEAQKNLTIQ